jgi:protein NirF
MPARPAPKVQRFEHIGKQPYDGLASSDGRYFIAGLYGEDGLALLDSWHADAGVRRILAGYGRGRQTLPVYKMPHLRGWSIAGDYAFLPAIGQHEVLVADNRSWAQVATVPVLGQPVFVMAEPGGRRVWVNFAFPDNDKVQVIDVPTRQVIKTLQPGRAILHMEFTARGDAVWLSSRDDNKLVVIDTATLTVRRTLPALEPSGIFFSSAPAAWGCDARLAKPDGTAAAQPACTGPLPEAVSAQRHALCRHGRPAGRWLDGQMN